MLSGKIFCFIFYPKVDVDTDIIVVVKIGRSRSPTMTFFLSAIAALLCEQYTWKKLATHTLHICLIFQCLRPDHLHLPLRKMADVLSPEAVLEYAFKNVTTMICVPVRRSAAPTDVELPAWIPYLSTRHYLLCSYAHWYKSKDLIRLSIG